MKEVTYGWYPSVKDIYRPKGRPSSHHLQCLYKFNGYQAQPVVQQAELFVRGVSSCTTPDKPQHLKHKSKSAPIPKLQTESIINIPTPAKCWSKSTIQETQWGVCPNTPDPPSEVSWPILQDGKQQQEKEHQEEKNAQQKQQQLLQEHLLESQAQKIQQQLLHEHLLESQERYLLEGNEIPRNAWGFRNPSQDFSDLSSEASSRLTWPIAHKARPTRPHSSFSGQSDVHGQDISACNQQSDVHGQDISVCNQQSDVHGQDISACNQQSDVHGQDISVCNQQRPASSPAQGHRDIRPPLIATPPSKGKHSSRNVLFRTQSATVRHHKIQPPTRPATAFTDKQLVQGREAMTVSRSYPGKEDRPPTRWTAADTFVNNSDEPADCPGITPLTTSASCPSEAGDYETAVQKYGWRAQIHGDPYQLKRPMKRESYTVTCTAPYTLPDPPSIHMETKEPFFYNTIPKKALSYSVDRQWMSEVLLAKRLQLQKRDSGIRYNYRKFAFVY